MKYCSRNSLLRHLVLWCCLLAGAKVQAQQLLVNLSSIDGIELTPENIFNYQVQSTLTGNVSALIKGRVVFRGSGQSFSYSYPYTIRPGVNQIDPTMVRPQWTFSTGALRELFLEYKKLPAGTYEYCVEIGATSPGGELVAGSGNKECLFHKVDDVFVINLVDPENNAKIHEYFPVLSWTVNYPFASALTYKLRVAAVKDGQNNTAAINRNNPVYQEKNIMQTSLSYPVYAKPLEAFQPYAWTVDAYYKGILLGGAEPWRFTIIEDSVMQAVPRELSHIDLRREHGLNTFWGIGQIKLKYVVADTKTDVLQLSLVNEQGKEVKLKTRELHARYGDNRYELPFETLGLKHMKLYRLRITNNAGEEFIVPFKYVNPLFL